MTKKIDKKNLVISCLGVLLGVCSALLLAFAVKGDIPTLIDFNERIVALGSKWLFLCVCLPPILFGLGLLLAKRGSAPDFFLKMALIFFAYLNMVSLIVLIFGEGRALGEPAEVPITAVLLLPLPLIYLLLGIKVRAAHRDDGIKIENRYTKRVEFIFVQTQFFAGRTICLTALALMLASFVLSFFRLGYIMLALLIVGIVTDWLLILHESKQMYKKYSVMKAKKDRLDEKKQQK